MRYERTLLSFEEDIRRRTFGDWLKAHVSFMKPLHRYTGSLWIEGGKLLFEGRDTRVGGRFGLAVPLADIREVRLGFDDLFRRWEDNDLGIFGLAPVRIIFRTETIQRTAYLYAGFRQGIITRRSENRRLLEELRAGGAGNVR
jgi:hypothetical protein